MKKTTRRSAIPTWFVAMLALTGANMFAHILDWATMLLS